MYYIDTIVFLMLAVTFSFCDLMILWISMSTIVFFV